MMQPSRLRARGLKQVDGFHYDSNAVAAPAVDDLTDTFLYLQSREEGYHSYLMSKVFINNKISDYGHSKSKDGQNKITLKE